MATLFPKGWFWSAGERSAADRQEQELSASSSFLESRFDGDLALRVAAAAQHNQLMEEYLSFIAAMGKLQGAFEEHSLVEELQVLEQYIHLYQKSCADHSLTVKIQLQLDADAALKVPCLLLFALVKNALLRGYHGMDQYPVKITVKGYAKALQLHVSNRVNHHLARQEDDPTLALLRARLDFCSRDKYQLLFNSNSHTFRASLLLQYD